jgi:hypothetical protein
MCACVRADACACVLARASVLECVRACVFVRVLSLVIPHESCIFPADNTMIPIILNICCQTVNKTHFLTLPHKRHDFRKRKYTLNLKKRVLIFSPTWSVTFLVLRRI